MENQPQVQHANNLADKRSLIPMLFAAAIIFFFFNFFTISCGGEKVKEVKGIDLVIGSDNKDQPNTTVKSFFSEKPSQDEKIPSNVWAIIAFGAAIIGLGVFLLKEKREAYVGTVAGTIGAASLLILQNVVKKTIETEADGAPITLKFEFAFWAALIAMGIAAYISYLRLQKLKSVILKATPQASNEQPASPQQQVETANSVPERGKITSHASPQQQVETETISILQENSFDTNKWVKRNKLVVAGLLMVGIAGYGLYYFVLRNDPVSDGKNVAIAQCDCQEEYLRAQINALQDFNNKFDTYKFKNRQVAKATVDTLLLPSLNIKKCFEEPNSRYEQLNAKFAVDKDQKEKFDFAYNAQNELCKHDTQESLIKELYKLAVGKISTINDPLPDIEKIKADLIGQILNNGWRFDYLNEFKGAEIINVAKGANRVEYQIRFDLIDIATQSEHECEVMVVYFQNKTGWFFNNVSLIYFTYTNIAPVDDWNTVSHALRDMFT